MEENTICAIATGKGGAIGIIRVSGNLAIEITDKIFRSSRANFTLKEAKSHTISFGRIIDNENKTIDEVLVSVFRAPHSYTGENSTEISCHNSTFILQEIIKVLLANGCNLAEPGEYTKRAFLNGKLDLTQAEAVADLINSTTASAHRVALNQLRNGFSKEFKALREKLLKLSTLMELELDFSDHEELEFANREELDLLISEIENKISRLAESFNYGNAIKEGIPIAIVGNTNVGKSTLLNALINEDKAIVSDIDGTTRDVIEDIINIDGYLFRIADTAGIRDTDNEVERIGIQRTLKQIEQADIVLCVLNPNEELPSFDFKNKKVIFLCNKYDILSKEDEEKWIKVFERIGLPYLFISAKEKINIEQLKSLIITQSSISEIKEDEFIVTNLRHYSILKQALDSARKTKEGIQLGTPTDLVSEDLRDCLNHLSEIVGEVSSTEILHNIFSSFCIGK